MGSFSLNLPSAEDDAAVPTSPLNPHRPLVASGSDSQSSAAGQLSFRAANGKTQYIRVLQEQERVDANIRKVRWVFSEETDTFQIELRHGRASGLRKIYVNKEAVVERTLLYAIKHQLAK